MSREVDQLYKRLANRLPRFTKDAQGNTVEIVSPDNKLAISKAGTSVPGDRGATGSQGEAGLQGERGPAGPEGPPGARGAQGEPGPQGQRGEAGAVGPMGSTGLRGEQGIPGPKGETGIQGPAGIVGPEGPEGRTGAQGPAGPKGDTGTAGAPGLKGDTGSQGPAGPKGDIGATGPQGPASTARQEYALRVQTDTAGRYAWTFPAAFPVGVLPVVQITVQDTSAGSFNHKITALSNTGVTIQLVKTTAVNPVGLGVTLLGIDTNPQAVVHLTAMAPG